MDFRTSTVVLGTSLKFMFSKKATKIDEIFAVDLMLCSKRQMSIFVAFLDNVNFIKLTLLWIW